jgi:hypothetical protein
VALLEKRCGAKMQVDFHSVNIADLKAQIMYTTGETEELDLKEIVKEAHMMLITG